MKVSIERALECGAEFKAYDEENERWRESWDYSELDDGYEIFHSGAEPFKVKKGALVIVSKEDVCE